MNIEKLRELNPNTEIFDTDSKEFRVYGRKLDLNTDEIVKVAEGIKNPEIGSLYDASLAEFENLKIAMEIGEECFGEMGCQVGYCRGHSNSLNAFEWHTSSEINVAVTDLVLILARVDQIENQKIDSSLSKVFYIKKGEAVEVYATSLHFCPCEVEKSGFGCVVALPRGTNAPLERVHNDRLLFRKNKWIIAHVENATLIERGVTAGVYGENIEIKY